MIGPIGDDSMTAPIGGREGLDRGELTHALHASVTKLA